MDERKDDELVILSRKDKENFARIVNRYKNRVYNIAYNYFYDYDEANDCAQEAFVKVYKSLSSYKLGTNFKAWLFRITHNLCIDRIRKKKKEIRLEDNPEIIPYSEDDPDIKLSLEEAVGKLSPEYRAIIGLRYQEDLSYEEISKVMNIPIGTVKTWLFRAKGALKKNLQ
ncbi:MAG: RNA polymerase sigma factor [bacterium]